MRRRVYFGKRFVFIQVRRTPHENRVPRRRFSDDGALRFASLAASVPNRLYMNEYIYITVYILLLLGTAVFRTSRI